MAKFAADFELKRIYILTTAIIVLFVVGYLGIALEHPIKINKTVPALLTGVVLWLVYILSAHDSHEVKHHLSEHLSEISEILFFLLGAMTIVELIDLHQGFNIITDSIKTRDTIKLVWIIGIVSFFLSAVLDSLASAILMVTLLRKLIPDGNQRKLFAGLVVIAVNSSAWSPIGPVTTTMLWIGGQISAGYTIVNLFLPSLVGLFAALAFFSFSLRKVVILEGNGGQQEHEFTPNSSKIMLIVGVASLLFVPVFKQLTHLPPYMAMMFSLGVMWLLSEMIDPLKDVNIASIDEEEVQEGADANVKELKIGKEELRKRFTVSNALSRIDTSSILFFLGILLAVGSLEATGILHALSAWMDENIGNLSVIAVIVGVASSIVDNVPLVAATQGMYDLNTYLTDHHLWQLLTYCAATGGSLLVIGSAAGVAVMGMEHLNFMWYVRKISLPAVITYVVGIGVYFLVQAIFH